MNKKFFPTKKIVNIFSFCTALTAALLSGCAIAVNSSGVAYDHTRNINYTLVSQIGDFISDNPSEKSLPIESAALIIIESLEHLLENFFDVNLENKEIDMAYLSRQEAAVYRNIDLKGGEMFEHYVALFNEWADILGMNAEEFATYMRPDYLYFSDLENIAYKVGVPVEESWPIVSNVLAAFDTFERKELPSRWIGLVNFETDDPFNNLISSLLCFIDAESGKVLKVYISQIPSPDAEFINDRPSDRGMFRYAFTGLNEYEREYIIDRAKQLVQKLNVLDDDILTANIANYEPSIALNDAVWVNITVEVHGTISGESAQLIFGGTVGGEKALESIRWAS